MSDEVVRVESLTKRYAKGARGIEDVTFEVKKGEVFGFLGPNGAGKSTTMRVLVDLLRATSGRASIFGLDTRADRLEIHRRIGYLPGEGGLAERDTVSDHLKHHAALRGGVPRERIESLAARLDLDLARVVRALSRGNRQKVGLVQALMHEPDLLILDEPTSGLDPLMQQEFYKLVHDATAAGRTVFISSHILPEVEALCDRVAIIREGKIVAVDAVKNIKANALRRVRASYSDGRVVEREVRGPTGAIVRELATSDLVDFSTLEPTLEDVFLAYYERSA